MEINDLLAKVSENLQGGRSFGPATQHGEVTLVPVAFVIGGGGGGSGTQPGTDGDNVDGSGGGFGSLSWPIGAYVIKGDDVQWRPALDVTRLAVAGIGLAKLLVKLRSRATR